MFLTQSPTGRSACSSLAQGWPSSTSSRNCFQTDQLFISGFSPTTFKKVHSAPRLLFHSSPLWSPSLSHSSFSHFTLLGSSAATVLCGFTSLRSTKRLRIHQEPLKSNCRAQNCKSVLVFLRSGVQTWLGDWGSPTTCTTTRSPPWSLVLPPSSPSYACLPRLLSQSFSRLKGWWWLQLPCKETDPTMIWRTDRQELDLTWSTRQGWIRRADFSAEGATWWWIRKTNSEMTRLGLLGTNLPCT